jgi:hypothetical protein
MRFYIIENVEDRLHLSWIGKYTYGTCMIRGISINLFSEYGKIWDNCYKNRGDYDFTKDEPDKITYILNDNDDVNFRDDCRAFRMEYFSQFEEILNSFTQISSSNNNKILYSSEKETYLELYISKDELLSEIKEINEYCEKNNITCDWV